MDDKDNVTVPMMSEERGRGGGANHTKRDAGNPVIKTFRRIAPKLKDNSILIFTVTGVLGGCILGFLLRAAELGPDGRDLVSFPGDIFFRLLKLLTFPLIVSSLITGLVQLDTKSSGKIGTYSLIYYFATTVMAAFTGICLVLIIHPGDESIKENLDVDKETKTMSTMDGFLDLIRNMFPDNLVQACFQQIKTVYKPIKRRPPKAPPVTISSFNFTTPFLTTLKPRVLGRKPTTALVASVSDLLANASNATEPVKMRRDFEYTNGMNILGVITFCVVFGIILGQMKSQAKVMVDFFWVLNEITMKMMGLIMWYSPIGIMSLIAGKIIGIEDLQQTAAQLSYYVLTVLLGLIIHACGTLSIMFWLVTRRNPLQYFRNMIQAWLMAVGTASSSATLPLTFRCLEENNGIDRRVTRFVLPVGATVNMDGTALYEAVATIFIAQLNGVDLSPGQVTTVCITSMLASVGAASIPSAGLVTMLMVLTAVGLPTEDVSYIFAVDWMLDRIRTSVNVLGDAYGAGIVHHLYRHELEKLNREEKELALADGNNQDHETIELEPTPIMHRNNVNKDKEHHTFETHAPKNQADWV